MAKMNKKPPLALRKLRELVNSKRDTVKKSTKKAVKKSVKKAVKKATVKKASKGKY